MDRLKLFFNISAPYWKSKEGRFGWLLLGITLILSVLVTYSSVRFTQWNGDFYSALESKSKDKILEQALVFIYILSAMSIINVNHSYFLRWLKIHWRSWLTENYVAHWLQDDRFYHLKKRNNIDNIDQRISQDIEIFINETLGLIFSFLDSVMSIVSFSVILWTLSGVLDFTLFGQEYHIHGYLVYGAVIYALVGFLFARIVGRKLKPLSWERQKVEADYRAQLMKVSEHHEAIAMAKGAEFEKVSLRHYFVSVYANTKARMKVDRRFNLYTLFYGQGMFIPPMILSIPQYLSGVLDLGGLMQLRIAFSQVVGSLSWFTNSYDQIMSWFATMDRLGELRDELSRLSESEISISSANDGLIINNLTLLKPSGEHLLKVDNWDIKPGGHYQLCGRSGAGKTSIIKAICGLWAAGKGEINCSENMLVIPQRGFIPEGSLRAAIAYPESEALYSESDYIYALKQVDLDGFTDKLDVRADWHQLLSGGERQKLALSRCFLKSPDLLIMDESFSAIDDPGAKKIINNLFNELNDSAIVCISHSTWISTYFNHTLKAVYEFEDETPMQLAWQSRSVC